MIRSLFLCALLLFATSAAGQVTPAKPTRILFVGNSITYVNNLPATFAALAQSQGRAVEATMLVRGGETLTEHLASGVLTDQVLSGFDVVILQERGGDLFCADYDAGAVEQCRLSRQAYKQLVDKIRASGAVPILLGTYQTGPASAPMEQNEGDLARELAIDRVAISEDLRRARSRQPGAEWFAADGLHPGGDLSMLMAIKLYPVIFHAPAQARDVLVRGDRYDNGKAHFSGTELLSEPASAATRSFSSARIASLLTMASTGSTK